MSAEAWWGLLSTEKEGKPERQVRLSPVER